MTSLETFTATIHEIHRPLWWELHRGYLARVLEDSPCGPGVDGAEVHLIHSLLHQLLTFPHTTRHGVSIQNLSRFRAIRKGNERLSLVRCARIDIIGRSGCTHEILVKEDGCTLLE